MYLLIVHIFQYIPKEKMFFIYVKTMIHVTVHAAVLRQRKTSVRLTCKWPTTRMLLLLFARQCLVHNNCKTEVRCLRASHVACTNSSLNVTPATRTWNLCLSYDALSITSTRLLTLRSATGTTTGKTRSTRTITKHVRSVVTGALALVYNAVVGSGTRSCS